MSFKEATAEFIETPVKTSTKLGRAAIMLEVNKLSSFTLTWILIKRHKVALLAIGNIILALNYIMPEWGQLVLGLLGK